MHSQMLGRPIAILLTGGQAHDCPVAERLIRRVKPSKCMLGDAAYDSGELREQLDDGYVDVSGIKFPTVHPIFARQADASVNHDPLVVSIDLLDIRL